MKDTINMTRFSTVEIDFVADEPDSVREQDGGNKPENDDASLIEPIEIRSGSRGFQSAMPVG